MVFPCLLSLNELLEPGEGTERVDDDLARIRVVAEEELSLGDVTGVVRNRVGDVPVVEGGHSDDCD